MWKLYRGTMTNLDKQQEVVKRSLFQFVTKNIPNADLSVVDEIVLSYVISILEESSDPCFDVDGFIEMMSAYFPDFNAISSADVCTWLFTLESELSGTKTETFKACNVDISIHHLANLALNNPPAASVEVKKQECIGNKRVQHLSETSDCGSSTDSSCDFYSDECDILQEMFPESSHLEVKHCITIANGDVDRATQILLHRQESNQSIPGNNGTLAPKPHSKVDDAELKNRIIAR